MGKINVFTPNIQKNRYLWGIISYLEMIKKPQEILFQLKESLFAALGTIRTNKYRTFLTLFGITIGVISIITAFTIIDSLKIFVKDQFKSLGSNVLYVQQFSFLPEGDGEYKWWEMMARPKIKINEFNLLKDKLNGYISDAGFNTSFSRIAKAGRENIKVYINANTSGWYNMLEPPELEEGRMFTPMEFDNITPVAIIGDEVATSLFPNSSALNKKITIDGKKFTVIGVKKKKGNSTISINGGEDRAIDIPYNVAKTMVSIKNTSPAAGFKAAEGISNKELREQIQVSLRNIRRISPLEKDDFAINDMTQLLKMVDNLFTTITLAGVVIGLFSIIIGGIGVANIMFVSVRERTPQIGIQKALGAKSYAILSQYLFEAIILSTLGGIIGLGIVYGLTFIASNLSPFPITLSIENMALGILISIGVGIVSGYIPAKKAADMDPIKAIYNG